jgi:predicted transcriptional regulator
MDIAFTERELDVMNVLWQRGSGTVAEVQEGIADALAYTTVLTIMRTLEDKGYTRHEEEGRAYRYYPLVDRDAAGASAVRRLVRKLFSNSPEMLLTHLVSERDLTEAQLERMRELLEARLSEGGES